jgi:hypothetical protein
MEERKDELLHNSFNNTLEQKEVRQKKNINSNYKTYINIFKSIFRIINQIYFFPKKK